MIPAIRHCGKGKTTETIKRSAARGQGLGARKTVEHGRFQECGLSPVKYPKETR